MTDRASFWHLRRFVDKLPGGILCNKTLSLGKNRTYSICIHQESLFSGEGQGVGGSPGE